MDLNDYQTQAQETDRVRSAEGTALVDLIVPLLGLAGETGELLSEYKKHLRDGEAHVLFKDRVAEELGDLLWYIANVASKFDLALGTSLKLTLRRLGIGGAQGGRLPRSSTRVSRRTSGCRADSRSS